MKKDNIQSTENNNIVPIIIIQKIAVIIRKLFESFCILVKTLLNKALFLKGQYQESEKVIQKIQAVSGQPAVQP